MHIPSARTSLINEIHRLLRLMQSKYRRVRKGSELPGIIDVHILVELGCKEDLSVNELANSLCVDQSQISRTLQKLRSQGFIAQRSKNGDTRYVLSRLTTTGKQIVKRIDIVIQEIFNKSTVQINNKQEQDLLKLFKRVVNSFDISNIRIRKGESQLRAYHRQLARVFGFLRKDVFGSGLTRSRWAVLETIANSQHAFNASTLATILGIRQSHLSEILTSFEVAGYIERFRSVSDHKVLEIRATASGRKYFQKLELKAVNSLRPAIKGFSVNELSSLVASLKLFAGEWGRDSVYLDSLFVTKRIDQVDELRSARAFCLRNLVAKGWEIECPDPLIPSNAEVWGLFSKSSDVDDLKALVIAVPGLDTWSLQLAINEERLPETQFNAFIQHCHYLSGQKTRRGKIQILFAPLENHMLETGSV